MINKVTLTKFPIPRESKNHRIFSITPNVVTQDDEDLMIHCYCCEEFTPHVEFPGDDCTFYECDVCGCVIDDSEQEVIKQEIREDVD